MNFINVIFSRVVLIAPNSFQWVAIDLATFATGAILVPLYSRFPEIDLDAIIGDWTPEIIIYDEIFKNENSFKEPILECPSTQTQLKQTQSRKVETY